MVIDNVGKELTSRHQGGTDVAKPRKVHVWTMAYAVRNRVYGGNYEEIPETSDEFCSKLAQVACDQNVADYLPREGDHLMREKRFSVLIKRILTKYVSAFSGCDVTEHIDHPESAAMAQKSDTAVIGVIQENPGTSDGMIAVTNYLQRFIPYPNGKLQAPVPIPVHGDAATVLQLYKAMRSRRLAPANEDRLNGIWPVPGEFHRRMLNIQDCFDMLFTPGGSNSPGTLANIKARMNFLTAAPKKVTSTFHHCEEMLHCVTKGLVILAAMEILGLDKVDGELGDEPERELERVTQALVSFFTFKVSRSNVQEILDERVPERTDDYGCKCGEIDGEGYRLFIVK